MGKNGYEDDTDYTASFTTDKDYVSKYPDGLPHARGGVSLHIIKI